MKFFKVIAALFVASVLTAFFAELLVLNRRGENGSNNGEEIPPLTDEQEPVKIADYSGFATGEAVLSQISVSARSAMLCSSDGYVIFEKNADTPLPMASITKVMSAIVALELIDDTSKTVTVPREAVGIEGSSVYLESGEKVTYEMLLYSTMLESANDAVTALAILTAGSEEEFVFLMNKKAKELSMGSTHFCNPHGLSEAEHFTTARDYTKLMAYSLNNEAFCNIIKTKKILFEKLDGSMTRVLTNHNRLLNTYSGMLGGKTGFTKASGRTLVTAASKNGTTIICVTLDAPDDWHDHTSMLDAGFEAVKTVDITKEELAATIPVATGVIAEIEATAREPLSFTCARDDEITFDIITPHIVFAPISKGDTLGRAKIFKNGKLINEIELVASEKVNVLEEKTYKEGVFDKILGFFRKEKTSE